MGVHHAFVNHKPDGPDTSVVRPSDWNAEHEGAVYHHAQMVPSTVWTVTHNLGRHPNVTVLDSAGSQVEVDVFHTSTNVLTLTLAYAVSGTADCS